MAGGGEQKCQSRSSPFSSASGSGSARAAAGALGPRSAAQRQQLLQSLLQVWQCGFTLYIPPPGGPRPARAPPPPPPPASLPRARPLARGCWRRQRLGRASCTSSRGAAADTTAPGAVAAPEPAPLPGLLLPGSEAAAVAAALASSRLARSLRGSYTCVTDRAKSQLLPGSAADVSDPQPLGGRIVQAE